MKKALVIGVDKYINPDWNLQGCVADASAMYNLLIKNFEFDRDDVRMIVDRRATTENIRSRLDWLVRDTHAGDSLVFFFAGHGSRLRDRDGDELDDRMDECLVPHDHDWNDALIDDELNEYFSGIHDEAQLTVIFDCCNSGSGTRKIIPPPMSVNLTGSSTDSTVYYYPPTNALSYIPPIEFANRYLPPPPDIEVRSEGRSLNTRRLGEVSIKDNHVLLSACQNDQQAQETVLDGRRRGIFTYTLEHVVKEFGTTLSYQELHDRVVQRIQKRGYVQVPQLECPVKYLKQFMISGGGEQSQLESAIEYIKRYVHNSSTMKSAIKVILDDLDHTNGSDHLDVKLNDLREHLLT